MIDPDLLRAVLLALEKRERSPPEAVLVSFTEFSQELKCPEHKVHEAVELLNERELIQGPGFYLTGYLFRGLSEKARIMVHEMRSARAWERIKSRYHVLPSG